MENQQIILQAYQNYLCQEEKGENTIAKYTRDVQKFLVYLGNAPLDKKMVLNFKKSLVDRYKPTSVNSILAAVNNFLDWNGFAECKVKSLKIQRELYAKEEKELSVQEYYRLIEIAARKKNKQLSLVIQTICATGIRVSELKFITVEALTVKCAVVACKGKRRTVFIPKELCKKLREYCKVQKIEAGCVFVTRNGKRLDRSNIWKQMKALYKEANVLPQKIFPHNLRHLFARTHYKLHKDMARLADLLGHYSINTTRIYTMETGKRHARQLENMKLVYQ